MSEIWPIAITFGIFSVAVGGLFLNYAGRFLSIREHESYQEAVRREMDKLHERVNTIEQTRPTTGELEARLNYKKSTKNDN